MARSHDDGVAPLSDTFDLEAVVKGLADDLDAVRGGRISLEDAAVRAALAKQIFNGVRLVISASNMLASKAKLIGNEKAAE